MTEKPKLTIDGRVVEFEPGDTIMRAAERVNIDQGIPRFCYHPGLPVAGTCRMCTVEVEKAPKLMTACSTPASDGMIVHTQSERVRKSRAGVMEFLLINHPLDCPVCDQAGECSLQDYNYEYGPGKSSFTEEKRVYEEATTKRLSDKLTLNMNRCIHCERCVRYTEDVTKTNELLMDNRGWKELVVAGDLEMFNEYQGNIADICPVGAITFNDFRFRKRVWFLNEKPSICDGCAKGCSVWADEDEGVVYRYRARENQQVNGHWICDEGRVSYHTHMNKSRVVQPLIKTKTGLNATTWHALIPWLNAELANAKRVLLVLGTDATSEEAATLAQILPDFVGGDLTVRSWNGHVANSFEDEPIDKILRRKDKTPNTKGIEQLGIHPFNAEMDKDYDVAIFFRSGRATIPEARLGRIEVAWGVFQADEIERFAAFLPGLANLEKAGTYTQCDGVTQSFELAVKATGACQSVKKILDGMKLKSTTQPKTAREVMRDSV